MASKLACRGGRVRGLVRNMLTGECHSENNEALSKTNCTECLFKRNEIETKEGN